MNQKTTVVSEDDTHRIEIVGDAIHNWRMGATPGDVQYVALDAAMIDRVQDAIITTRAPKAAA